MDVTCERCGTEYEFDETLVSGRGTTVKCTNCGHLFKVFRPEAEGSSARAWSVRTADGAVRKLSSLKELQRLITAGALSPEDLIARGSEPYKRLGDIAELSTFFAAAAIAVADTSVDLDHRPRRRTSPGMAASPPADPPPPRHPKRPARSPDSAPAPRARKSTMLGVGGSRPASAPPDRRPPAPSTPKIPPAPRVPKAATPPRRAVPRPPAPSPKPQPPPAPARPPSSQPPVERPPVERPPVERPPVERPPATQPSPAKRERSLYIEDDEPVVPQRGNSRSGLWVALVVLIAAAVGVALGWPQIAPLLGLGESEPEEDPAAAHLARGDEALAQDTVAGYEQALYHYTQALAFDDHAVGTLTRISRAHALWAQALTFDADDLAAMGADDPTRLGEANALRRGQAGHAETALARAEDAVRYGSSSADADVALADALRLTGDLARSRSRLNRALTLEAAPDAEALRVQALLLAAESEGELAAAGDLAEQSVAEDPALIRARLLYARALLARGDVPAARSQVEAILRRAEGHERAVSLQEAIERGRPPAREPGDDDDPDASPPDEAPATEAPAAPAAPSTDEPRPSSGGRRRGGDSTSGGAPPSGRDYSWYVRRGDELMARGNVSAARQHYDAARAERPSGSEALTGLGNCRLHQGDVSGAAAAFRQAAGQGYGEAYIGLGRAYRRLGRDSDALAAFQRYLQRMPSGPHAPLARRQVEELERRTAGSASGGSASGGSGAGGSGAGGSGAGGSGAGPGQDNTQLPPPTGQDTPPPVDVPAIDSEP